MTEDYKNINLDYITNDITVGSQGQNDFRDVASFNNNFTTILQNQYNITPSTMLYLTSETTSNFIIYGNYDIDGNYNYRGYIAVLNQKGEIEACFTTFDSGTQLSYLWKLQYDENGNIYGVDETNYRLRVILLNNVAIKGTNGYTCRLRNSYYVPSEYDTFYAGYDYDTPGYIKKAEGKATYYLFGDTLVSGNTSRPTLIKFVINVGSANEWDAYYYGTGTNDNIQSSDFYIEPGDENDTVVGLITYYAGVEEFKYTGTSLTRTQTYSRPTGYNSFETSRIVSEGNFFTCVRKLNADDITSSIYEYDGSYTLINSINLPDTSFTRRLCYVNGILFDKIRKWSDTQTTYVGFYDGTDYISQEIPYISADSGLEVLNNFGLYQMLIQDTNRLLLPSVVIYGTSYSGAYYTDYNSLLALHGELYSGGYIVFARTLSNRQVYQNTTTSTLNVPNNYLNGLMIIPKNLVSETMTCLTSDNNAIEKNIYENVMINFINKTTVVDEDTSTLYPNTASYINANINTGTQTNCENTAITKIRINYKNGAVVQPITWTDISSVGLIAKQTQFTITVSSELSTIDFISEDETFTYITKEYDNLQVGTTYTIFQKIRIE